MAVVAVAGPGARDAEPSDLADAYELGRLLAEQGLQVLTGGLDGVMSEAARSVRDGGGVVVGLLPGNDPHAASEYLTLAVPTGLGQLRNGLLVTAADAVVAVGCSWGTLSEIALAQRLGKPLVCLRPWVLRDTRGQEIPVPRAADPDEAARMIAAALAG